MPVTPGGNFKKVQIRIWDSGPSSGGKVFTGGSSWGTEVTDTPPDTNWFDTTSSAAYSAGSSSGTWTYTMPALTAGDTYYIYARVIDQAGNTQTSFSYPSVGGPHLR